MIVTPIEVTDFTEPVAPLMPGESRPFGFALSVSPTVQQVASPYVTVNEFAFSAGAISKPLGATIGPAVAAPSASPSPSAQHQP